MKCDLSFVIFLSQCDLANEFEKDSRNQSDVPLQTPFGGAPQGEPAAEPHTLPAQAKSTLAEMDRRSAGSPRRICLSVNVSIDVLLS